jgi:cytidylate kinase
MPIVTISRGSYTKGREVAEKLGQKMGYNVISREVLLSTSKEYNIPEIKLKKALHDAPSVLERFSYGKEKYLAFIRANILEHMVQDNTIYHGLAGHAFVQGVGHELDIRIRASIEDRIQRYREYIKKEEGKDISEEDARYWLRKDDEERHKWSIHVTGIDPCDPSHYDVIYNASKFSVDDIVDSIAHFLNLPYMQATPESQKRIEQLMKAAQVKAAIVYDLPKADVTVKDDVAYINFKADLTDEGKIVSLAKEKASTIEGIKEVNVYVSPYSTD